MVEVFAVLPSWGLGEQPKGVKPQRQHLRGLGKVSSHKEQRALQYCIIVICIATPRPTEGHTSDQVPPRKQRRRQHASLHAAGSPTKPGHMHCPCRAAETPPCIPLSAKLTKQLHIAAAAAPRPQVRQPVAGPRLVRALLRDAQQARSLFPSQLAAIDDRHRFSSALLAMLGAVIAGSRGKFVL